MSDWENEPDVLIEPERPDITVETLCSSCMLGHHSECDEAWIALQEGTDWTQCCCWRSDAVLLLSQKERAERLSSSGGSGYVATDGSNVSADDAFVAAIETYIPDFNGNKHPSDYKDPLSTGRKMAAEAAPIAPGMICEWAWLAKAGGGVVPIVGCPGRPASDRHHGPDKNTLHNQVGVNLHRICDWCHNQWHAKNDPFYGPRPTREDGSIDANQPFVPVDENGDPLPIEQHDPITRAPDDEVYAEDAARRAEARRHGAKI